MTTKFPTRPLSFDELGGEKEDYLGQVDPTTDRSADEVNTTFLATAMMSQTTVQAVCQFSCSAGPSIVPHFYRGLWGSALSTIPTITVLTTGSIKVTFPASFVDEQGDTVDVNMKAFVSSPEGVDWNDKPFHVTPTPLPPNSVLLSIHDVTGTRTFASGAVIGVCAL